MKSKVHYGRTNSNWKGGISSLNTLKDILDAGEIIESEIKRRIVASYLISKETGCWNWTKSIFQQTGRACLCIGTKRLVAARVVYALWKSDPGKNLVRHTCDNILCVNPEHLILGTNADNSRDMVERGRSLDQTGSLNHGAKLNEEIVATIKFCLRRGVRQNLLAVFFKVSTQTINLIAMGKTWRHVK